MTATEHVPTRAEAHMEDTWDLTVIYSDDAAWEADIARSDVEAQTLAAMQGTVGASAANLLRTLKLRDAVAQRLYQLYVYASMRKDTDQGDATGQGLDERAGSLVARTSATIAFVEPEILAIAPQTLEAWLDAEPELAVYRYDLTKLQRQRAHIRSAEVESVLAAYGDIARAPSDIFDILTNAELPFPTVTDERGQIVQLSHARYGRFMESPDRRVRHDAFTGMYGTFRTVRSTLGTTLAASTRSHALNARVRGYASSLDAALFPNEIPAAVYHNLIETINAGLPHLHRYLALRKRILGLDELHPYDLYVSLVPELDLAIPYTEGRETVQRAFAPLGDDYATALRRAFGERWIDVYENIGKRSGAYSSGAYTTPPYILLNYQDRLTDVFTLAHELGHSMHSYFTRRTQPFVYGDYTLFVAEVASTLNEALLTDYLLKSRDDASLRRRLIVQQLDDIRTTIFRQTMFSEFELDIHTHADAGEPLPAATLTERYYELVKRYHGPDFTADDAIGYEWTRVPHFYYNFYVYQYATGLSAALALSWGILTEGQPAVDRYLRFLSGGSSRSSIDLLKEAGVDMTTPAPIEAAMDIFAGLLDELEALEAARP